MAQAIAEGRRSMTHPYSSAESEMLGNVIADMERGQIDYALVEMPVHGSRELGVEVWRIKLENQQTA